MTSTQTPTPPSRARTILAQGLPVTRLVQTPRWASRPAALVTVMVLLAAVVLVWVPWVQTAQGEGRVIAWSALEREQRVEAPIEGRVVRWFRQEGEAVRKGDLIAELADNDPDILERLRIERAAVSHRKDATERRVKAIQARIVSLESSREAALDAAKHRVLMANNRIKAAKNAEDAAKAAVKAARANQLRQGALEEKGLVSQRQVELAELDLTRSETDLERAEAGLSLARSEQLAIESDRLKVEADTAALLEDAHATEASANVEIANAVAELSRIDVRLARQQSMQVVAQIDGTLLRLVARVGGEYVKAGDTLAVLVPSHQRRAIELWVDGRDMPLVQRSTVARIQFEGWPALATPGWPSIAIGTFEGRVAFVDATDDGKGKFRVVVEPRPNARPEDAWPDDRYLRQGVRAQGWFTLGEVPLGYELWRQFNGFAPTMGSDPHPYHEKADHTTDKGAKGGAAARTK
jgi:adhesin transport system membrane fusion protein